MKIFRLGYVPKLMFPRPSFRSEGMKLASNPVEFVSTVVRSFHEEEPSSNPESGMLYSCTPYWPRSTLQSGRHTTRLGVLKRANQEWVFGSYSISPQVRIPGSIPFIVMVPFTVKWTPSEDVAWTWCSVGVLSSY